jgi:hypothetical protein
MKNIIGVNSDKDFCECCGKQGISRVVWIENILDGTVSHYGTTCAAKIISGGKKKIKTATYAAADAMLNALAVKYSYLPKKECDRAIGAELSKTNAAIMFAGTGHGILSYTKIK